MSARERSCGTSTSTGPGRPVEAMWKAAWMYSGIWRGSVTRNECLTIGSVIPVTSASWNLSRDEHRRHRVQHGVGDGRYQVGRARARGRERHPDPARCLRVSLGRVTGALLVASLDVLEVRVVDRVVGRQVRAAWDPEDVLDPLGLQRFTQCIGGPHGQDCRADARSYWVRGARRAAISGTSSSPGFHCVDGRIARSITRSLWRWIVSSIERTSSSPRWCGLSPRSKSFVFTAL